VKDHENVISKFSGYDIPENLKFNARSVFDEVRQGIQNKGSLNFSEKKI